MTTDEEQSADEAESDEGRARQIFGEELHGETLTIARRRKREKAPISE
jgi:hypothetical protein